LKRKKENITELVVFLGMSKPKGDNTVKQKREKPEESGFESHSSNSGCDFEQLISLI
jgi:hypothetical protein